MLYNQIFFKSILDTVENHIVVIDKNGDIIFTNKSWNSFGENNHCITNASDWQKINYLEVCDKSSLNGESFGFEAAVGIRKVIENKEKTFYLEYPCHGKKEKRWFLMSVESFIFEKTEYFVISHQTITKRKLAEDKALKLSLVDGLTNIYNRRAFNRFIKEELKRCKRQKTPISLALLDIDYFKLLNDTYGHLEGDNCLKKIGKVLKKNIKRAGDICARYGGEEFALVLGNTSNENALLLIDKIKKDIKKHKIPNEKSTVSPIVTISIGLITINTDIDADEKEIIKKADELLYQAKQNGRNQVISKIE